MWCGARYSVVETATVSLRFVTPHSRKSYGDRALKPGEIQVIRRTGEVRGRRRLEHEKVHLVKLLTPGQSYSYIDFGGAGRWEHHEEGVTYVPLSEVTVEPVGPEES